MTSLLVLVLVSYDSYAVSRLIFADKLYHGDKTIDHDRLHVSDGKHASVGFLIRQETDKTKQTQSKPRNTQSKTRDKETCHQTLKTSQQLHNDYREKLMT